MTFNTNLLETNILNLSVVIGTLFYFGTGLINTTIETRTTKLRANLLAADNQAKQTKVKLEQLDQQRESNKVELDQVVLPRLRRALEEKQQLLTQKHESEINRLQTAQTATLFFEQGKLQDSLSQYVKNRAMSKSFWILERRLMSNPVYGDVILAESISNLNLYLD